MNSMVIDRRGVMRLVGGAGVIAAAGPSFAQSRPWSEVVEAAKKEGKVTIYSGHGLDQLNDLARRVKAEYGVTVQVVREIDSALTVKVDAERDSGRPICDVFVDTNLPGIKARTARGEVAAPIGPAFDAQAYNRKERVPENTYFEVSSAILTFSWNKDVFPKGIKDYPDMLDPALVGKVGVPAVLAPAFVDFYMFLEENYGADFLEKLARQKPRVYPSSLPMAQALVSGEIGAAVSTQPLIDEVAKGAPVNWGLAPKAWGARFYGQVLKNAPNPNAAQLLANVMVSRPGQEALARLAASALPDVTGAITSTANVRHVNAARLTPEFLAEFRERWRKLFQPG